MQRPPWPSARTRSVAAYHIVAATRGSGPVFQYSRPAAVPATEEGVWLGLIGRPRIGNRDSNTYLADASHLLLGESKAGQILPATGTTSAGHSAAPAAIAATVQVETAATVVRHDVQGAAVVVVAGGAVIVVVVEQRHRTTESRRTVGGVWRAVRTAAALAAAKS